MQLGELFSKLLRVDRPFGVFGLRVAPILARRAEQPPGTGPAGVSDGFDPADHRGERGRFRTLSAG